MGGDNVFAEERRKMCREDEVTKIERKRKRKAKSKI